MKKLHRSSNDQLAAGVCSGIGETYDIDPTVVRLAVVFLTLATGLLPLIITYAVAGLLVPKGKEEKKPE